MGVLSFFSFFGWRRRGAERMGRAHVCGRGSACARRRRFLKKIIFNFFILHLHLHLHLHPYARA